MNDLEFVQKCISGDKLAWDEFVDKYSHLVYRYIHSILKSQGLQSTDGLVQDLFQEVFLLLIKDDFQKLKTFQAKNGCSLASWLRQVTINHTIDYLRTDKPAISLDEGSDENPALIDTLKDKDNSVSELFFKNEQLESLADCIEKLSSEDKFFLELYLNRGLSLEELKGILKISRGAVDMRRSRIIDRLKNCFKAKGFALDFEPDFVYYSRKERSK